VSDPGEAFLERDEFLEDLIKQMTKAIETETMVVPDSIEPVYGWKALKITPDGRLASPQQRNIWPVKKRLEATCSSNRKTFAWTAVYGTPKDGPVEVSGTVAGGATFATSAVVSVGTGTSGSMMVSPSEKPKTQLPAGMSWSWEEQPHEIASNDCSCGIYVVDNVRAAGTYLSDDCILAEVCLWGRVVPGSEGSRGQYAYPRQLFAPDTLADVATLVAQLYGVPIGYRDHKTGKTLSHRQAMENLAAMKAARKPKPFEQQKVPMTQPSQILKLPAQIPPPAPQMPSITLAPDEEVTSFDPAAGGTFLISTASNNQPVQNRELRLKAQVVFGVCWVMVFFVWLAALAVHPALLVGVLPFFAVMFAWVGKALRS
jgi:hypothetical protein